MPVLVVVESAEGKIKKTSLEAVAYAQAMGQGVTAIALGSVETSELESLGKIGAQKVLHASDPKLNEGIIQVYASVLTKALQDEGADVLVLANSSLGTPVAARVAARIGASLASNVVEVPNTTSGFTVKRSIYTGKAFMHVELKNQKKVIGIRKNAAVVKEVGSNAQVTPYNVSLSDADFSVKITSS
jgi:electron transfer flavoprotein alpha subunit